MSGQMNVHLGLHRTQCGLLHVHPRGRQAYVHLALRRMNVHTVLHLHDESGTI